MIENGYLKQICEIVSEKGEIKTSELRRLGVAQYNQDKLIETGNLIRLRIGYYTVSSNLLKSYENSLEKAEGPKKQEEVREISISEVKLVDGYMCLINGEIDRGTKLIDMYLKKIGKEQYAFIVHYLIQLNCLEKDCAFIRTMNAIAAISDPNYQFDIEEFRQAYDKSLDEGDMRKARAYNAIMEDAREQLGENKLVLK